jgi:hypothetical protein
MMIGCIERYGQNENKRSLVPAFHQIRVHQNHPFGHGCHAPTDLLLVTFLTQTLVKNARISSKPERTAIVLLL